MADFGYLSDTDDSAVEELISQAKDLSVLEQVAAINCSSFTDSTLPDDLETRFRRLKSLPASRSSLVTSSSSSSKTKHLAQSKSVVGHQKDDDNFSGNRRNAGKISGSMRLSDEDLSVFSGNKHDLGVKSGFEKSYRARLVEHGSGDFSDSGKNVSSSFKSSSESKIFMPAKEKRRIRSASSSSIDIASPLSNLDTEERSIPKQKSKSKHKSSSWFDKLSPFKAIGCIWRSPTKSSTKTTIKNKLLTASHRDMDFDEFLSDLNAFSVEDQKKILKKALKEQQKMRKEAAEIIKLAKQASAKIDFDD